MATSRLSLVSRARYTSPMPPSPSFARTSYDATFCPVTSIDLFGTSRGPELRGPVQDDVEAIQRPVGFDLLHAQKAPVRGDVERRLRIRGRTEPPLDHDVRSADGE